VRVSLRGSVDISVNVVVLMFAYFLRDGLRLVFSLVDNVAAVVSPTGLAPPRSVIHSCSLLSENLRGKQVVLDKW
jgi:hypothetical protein